MTPPKNNNRPRNKPELGELRIIGGQWKRSKVSFPLLAGVRPTPSRIRETLFNWLATRINRSNCLDLFAGSGALGLEALSRGAAKVWLIDEAKLVTQTLSDHLDKLNAVGATVIQGNGLKPQELMINDFIDVVFCDPPFNQGYLEPLLADIERLKLAPDAMIYVESEKALTQLACPENWTLAREKVAGDVRYRLYQRD